MHRQVCSSQNGAVGEKDVSLSANASRFLGQVYADAMDEGVLISDIADYFFTTEEFAQ
ncbi:hypothetical protein [Sporosarcina saromensis]|uniref:hypothetical protein n=1 Tax=Sporosarcina saromensis TaxID=359365 RepID=UPI00295F1ACF|nr:hypothetical protein [Sporosarcina saromensis]